MNPLHEMIRRLPVGVEFLIVVSWAFGLEIFTAILEVSGIEASATRPPISNDLLVSFLVLKSLQFLFLVWFLRIRGWNLEKFGLHLSWRATAVGIALFGAAYLLMLGGERLTETLLPEHLQALIERLPKADPGLSMQLLYLVSTVGGIFEELFVAGYIITALSAARGVWTAINVSTVVRLLYHLYEGPLGVMTQVPIGLIFGLVYARTRQLWPLMLADVLVNAVALATGSFGP